MTRFLTSVQSDLRLNRFFAPLCLISVYHFMYPFQSAVDNENCGLAPCSLTLQAHEEYPLSSAVATEKKSFGFLPEERPRQ